MLKVMTIVGTRPELIKLCRVIDELDRNLTHILVHSGQNFDYELNQIFFEQLAIRRPDEFLNAAGGSAMETIAKVLTSGDQALQKHRPDAVLILGDTNSCLIAIAAKRRKIPVFHMEAGNRCFDQRVPALGGRDARTRGCVWGSRGGGHVVGSRSYDLGQAANCTAGTAVADSVAAVRAARTRVSKGRAAAINAPRARTPTPTHIAGTSPLTKACGEV